MKKSLIGILFGSLGVLAGTIMAGNVTRKTVIKTEKKVDKFKRYYDMLNQWMALKQEGKSLEEYFLNNGYKSVAIYGWGEMGNRLYEELENSSVEVKCVIDKNASALYSELEIKDLNDINDDMEDVDVIIVTAIFAFDEIVQSLSDKFKNTIISLEEVVVYNM